MFLIKSSKILSALLLEGIKNLIPGKTFSGCVSNRKCYCNCYIVGLLHRFDFLMTGGIVPLNKDNIIITNEWSYKWFVVMNNGGSKFSCESNCSVFSIVFLSYNLTNNLLKSKHIVSIFQAWSFSRQKIFQTDYNLNKCS